MAVEDSEPVVISPPSRCAMACADIFRVGGIRSLAKRVRDLDALLWAEGEVLENVPAFGLPKTSTFFHDSFHEKKI
jgi:hypothetical protein